jgi:hypothetical protein
MLYGFDTDDQNAATAALCLYAIYRSRNPKRLKVTPDFWGVIERAVRSTAKRATTIPVWIEKLKPKLGCETISPKWAATDAGGLITMLPDPRTGELMQVGGRPKREFLTSVIGEADNKAVLEVAYKQAAYVVLLVRDRLEREKPYEAQFIEQDDYEEAESDD